MALVVALAVAPLVCKVRYPGVGGRSIRFAPSSYPVRKLSCTHTTWCVRNASPGGLIRGVGCVGPRQVGMRMPRAPAMRAGGESGL